MKTASNNNSTGINGLPKKKSVGELIMEKIPKGKYAGITKMLEPHEIPELRTK